MCVCGNNRSVIPPQFAPRRALTADHTRVLSLIVARVDGHAPRVAMLALSGKQLLVGGVVVFEDVDELRDALRLDASVVLCCGNSKLVTAVDVSKRVVLYSVPSKRRLVFMARLALDEVLLVDSAGAVRCTDGRTGVHVRNEFAHFAPITAISVLRDRYIVTADADCQIRVSSFDMPREIVHFVSRECGRGDCAAQTLWLMMANTPVARP